MQRYNNFPIKRNSLAENRVSLNFFNYHTWIKYENTKRNNVNKTNQKKLSHYVIIWLYINNSKGQKHKKH